MHYRRAAFRANYGYDAIGADGGKRGAPHDSLMAWRINAATSAGAGLEGRSSRSRAPKTRLFTVLGDPRARRACLAHPRPASSAMRRLASRCSALALGGA